MKSVLLYHWLIKSAVNIEMNVTIILVNNHNIEINYNIGNIFLSIFIKLNLYDITPNLDGFFFSFYSINKNVFMSV